MYISLFFSSISDIGNFQQYGKFKTYNSIFAAAISNNVLTSNKSNESYVKNTAIELILGVHSPFLALLLAYPMFYNPQ